MYLCEGIRFVAGRGGGAVQEGGVPHDGQPHPPVARVTAQQLGGDLVGWYEDRPTGGTCEWILVRQRIVRGSLRFDTFDTSDTV